ncbi:MAG: hypothetical protein EBT47_07180, partial [Chloroflexi bacterium]|nr:hypothetical protein [Chloroflexota bacterium]
MQVPLTLQTSNGFAPTSRGSGSRQVRLRASGTISSGTQQLSSARGFPVAREVVSTKWELSGQTLLVIGLGDIGGSLAIRAEALGMNVIGVKRQPGHVPGCHRVVGLDHLDEVLPMADHVALCLPLTPETRHVIDATRIALIRDGAHVYNVGRGSLIDGTALRAALASGRLGGAGLDCVEPSDTPDPDDVLWEMPNVILGQHTSGHSPGNSRA